MTWGQKAAARVVWVALMPVVQGWLRDRLLIVPAKRATEWAKRLGCTPFELGEYNRWLAEQAAAELERVRI